MEKGVLMPHLSFRLMTEKDIPLYLEWAKLEHVKSVWFIEGYEPAQDIFSKIKGNGYDFPYILLLDEKPIGYIVYCDLNAYKKICAKPVGVFTNELPGTYCIDLFIGEENELNKGYGSKLVKKFTDMLFVEKKAKKILIDPSSKNQRAIRCYEKAGFISIGKDHDGNEEVIILEKRNPKIFH